MLENHSIFFYFGSFEYLKENMLESIRGSSDLYVLEYPFFSIDHARELQQKVSEHNVGNKKTYVLHISKIGIEAQHGLLKTCEEIVSADYSLVFCFPNGTLILETLLSRGVTYTQDEKTCYFDTAIHTAFLSQTNLTQRINLYETYTKKNKDLDPRLFVKYFLQDLLLLESKKTSPEIYNKKILHTAIALLDSIKTSPKQIYEYVALMLKK